jgi:hypothetical protein
MLSLTPRFSEVGRRPFASQRFQPFPGHAKKPLGISLFYTVLHFFFAPHELQLQIPKPIKNALFQSNSNLFKDKNFTLDCHALKPPSQT